MDADERGEVARLAGAVEDLAQAVEGIGAVLEQQGWMLRQLLDAAVTAPKAEVPLHELLVALIGRLDAQAGVLGRVEKGLEGIWDAVDRAGRGTEV